jgi:ABC-type glycerol-3-phosphate transport system permease component
MTMWRTGGRGALAALLAGYTAFALGPVLWLASMSLRTTAEIDENHYALPRTVHWGKFAAAWVESNYRVYFWNSVIVVTTAAAVVVAIGGMAGYCLARYRFRGNRAIFFAIFSTIMLPPQITVISFFQILVQYRLFNTLLGLVIVYVGIQLPLTVQILESFFKRLPQEIFDAARLDGCTDSGIYWRIAFPVSAPAIVTALIVNFILLWNEFLYAVVLITNDEKRTLPLGVYKFMGDQFSDVGMVATGAMISIVPVVVAYAFFSEKIMQGMRG